MTGSRPVRAVLFDWGGTITPWHTVDLLEQWTTFAAAVHDEPELAAALAQRTPRGSGAVPTG